MQYPTKKGQKYRPTPTSLQILTAEGFFGDNGVKYDTLAEVKHNNKARTFIGVINAEHGGYSSIKDCREPFYS